MPKLKGRIKSSKKLRKSKGRSKKKVVFRNKPAHARYMSGGSKRYNVLNKRLRHSGGGNCICNKSIIKTLRLYTAYGNDNVDECECTCLVCGGDFVSDGSDCDGYSSKYQTKREAEDVADVVRKGFIFMHDGDIVFNMSKRDNENSQYYDSETHEWISDEYHNAQE